MPILQQFDNLLVKTHIILYQMDVQCPVHVYYHISRIQFEIFVFVPFDRLVTDYPDAGKLFSFGRKNLTYDQLLRDRDARSHGRRVMETVGHAVDGINDLGNVVPILQDLAKRHIGYDVTKQLFEVSIILIYDKHLVITGIDMKMFIHAFLIGIFFMPRYRSRHINVILTIISLFLIQLLSAGC